MAFVVQKGKDNLRCCSRSPAPASLKILFRGLLWSFLLFHTFFLSSSYGSQDSSSGLSFAVFHHFSFRFFFQLHRLIVLISIQFFHLLMTLSLSILGFMFLLFLLSSVPRSLFFLCCYSLEWFLFCFCFLQNSTFFLNPMNALKLLLFVCWSSEQIRDSMVREAHLRRLTTYTAMLLSFVGCVTFQHFTVSYVQSPVFFHHFCIHVDQFFKS